MEKNSEMLLGWQGEMNLELVLGKNSTKGSKISRVGLLKMMNEMDRIKMGVCRFLLQMKRYGVVLCQVVVGGDI